MQNLMENFLKLTESVLIFHLELEIFIIMQLGVICAHMVDFCRPSDILFSRYTAVPYACSYTYTIAIVYHKSKQTKVINLKRE